MEIIYALGIVVFLLLLLTYAYGAISGAPWLPTKKKDVDRIIKFSGINKGNKFYEMGSGDGRLSIAAVEQGAKAYGYEVALLPYIISKIRRMFLKEKDNCKFELRNFWEADVSDADFAYVFLVPGKNKRIADKLKNEMKKGSKVIAYVWPFEGWEPLKVDKKDDRVNIYLYEI